MTLRRTQDPGAPTAPALAAQHRYLEIAEVIARELLDDADPGSRLPAEPQLATALGVSRTTVRSALAHLADRGLVRRSRGAGTFVMGNSTRVQIGAASDVGELHLLNPEAIVRFHLMSEALIELPAELRPFLTAPTGVVRSTRTLSADGRVIGVLDAHTLPHASATGDAGQPHVDHGIFRVVIDTAGTRKGRLLNSPPSTAVLSSRRIGFQNGVPVEVSTLVLVAERAEFVVGLPLPGTSRTSAQPGHSDAELSAALQGWDGALHR